jgi:hypothetical protein
MNTIPQTIYSQISISTKMSVGARKPIGGSNYLIFDVLTGSQHKVKITLNSLDLYDVQRLRIRKHEVIVVEELNNVYADQLNDVIYGFVNK